LPSAPSICNTPGCGEEVPKAGKCAECRSKANAKRPHADYGSKWHLIRGSYLKRHPVCEEPACSAKATDVHHLDWKGPGGDNSDANLQALCHSCHGRMSLNFKKVKDRVRGPAVAPYPRPVLGRIEPEQIDYAARMRKKRTEPEITLDDPWGDGSGDS
jgi:5-methylcytosine-specific restriction enzyme A